MQAPLLSSLHQIFCAHPGVCSQAIYEAHIIEGFAGKRALVILLISELCQNCSKFCVQFCLGALSNVLYVFLLKFALFLKYYIYKKPVFVVMSACDRKDGNFS